ncbi:MAG: hypothetical protein PHH98_00190 [Candidatus Gracilibacteria bacterium]|nr:hypothetical protein [Candidatus Gracilibacteria bacterium]
MVSNEFEQYTTYHIRSNTGGERQEAKKWEQAQKENQGIFENV